jgi:hypothetical protein
MKESVEMNFKINALRPLRVGRIVAVVVLAGLAQTALACNLGAWLGGNTGAPSVEVGQPNPDDIPRYSGVCAMATQDGTVGWVQDNSPGGISRIVARFYVLNNLAAGQSAILYRGFGDTGGNSILFTVRLATDGTVTLIDDGSGTNVVQNSNSAWTSIEIDWQQGNGTGSISLSVNGQTPVTTGGLSNSGNSLQSVRLGNLNGTNAGNLSVAGSSPVTFDAYESRRMTSVGRLCVGDADGNGEIEFFDVSRLFEEVSTGGAVLVNGQPDTDENGDVEFLDVSQTFDLVSSGASCP